ncbi:Arc family DNA-binding protein [Yersinia proxima]|uniref:Arc family DNA-binding protein n=1 Tax=Yersinia proxima TaxID=2890316 RepID=UPI001D119036|nr:Arc family DNA-binding protein [Yersinia proxima]
MQKDKPLWKFNARMPEELHEPMQQISIEYDRSMNYLIVKAVKEFIARNSEAPTTCDSQGFDLSHPA